MCRIFGFRSVIPSMVHRSLVEADNALCTQSRRHPDGWGVAYYVDGAPHVVKSAASALTDHLFKKVSGIVSSETVVAHIRKATVGPTTILNSHPFQYGRWVLCHNGTVPDFESVREKFHAMISPKLKRFILGETDSEVIFFLFLTQLSKYGLLSSKIESEDIAKALAETVAIVRDLADSRPGAQPAALTLCVTDGTSLIATRNGRQLFYSTYKSRCADRDVCPSFAAECEAPTKSGMVNHFILSSEPLGGENIWIEVPDGQLVGVDWRMGLLNRPLFDRGLKIVTA
jgi:glutamine amidotransferase